MPIFYEFDALAGGGKTYALVRQADKMARRGHKVLIVQPTHLLLDQTYTKELLPLAPRYPVTLIHTETVGSGNVVSSIVDHLKGSKEGVGEVLMITETAFKLVPYWHMRERWHVIVDEEINVAPSDTINVPETHRMITDHLVHDELNAKYSTISALEDEVGADGSINLHESVLKKIATNPHRDNVWGLLQDLTRFILDERYSVEVIDNQYLNLKKGTKDKAQLTYFATMLPVMFKGFASVTFCSALLKCTLMYLVWTSMGVEWQPVSKEWTKDLKYTTHDHGEKITFYYCSEDASWSKNFRERRICAEHEESVGDLFKVAIDEFIGIDDGVDEVEAANNAKRWCYMDNKDLATWPMLSRIPNKSHGLNSYQTFNNVIIMSALNPPPAYFAWLESKGINSEEARRAIYWCAVYQAMMRISIRDPKSPANKKVIVADKATALFFADIFSGAKVCPVPGLLLFKPKARKAGRPRKYGDEVDRRRARRDEISGQLVDQLLAVNPEDLSLADAYGGKRPLELAQVNPALQVDEDFYVDWGDPVGTHSEDKIPIKKGFTSEVCSAPKPEAFNREQVPEYHEDMLHLPIFEDRYSSKPFTYIAIDSPNRLIDALRELSVDWPSTSKHDSHLISPSYFMDREGVSTSRAIENVDYCYGIWLDCDDGRDLTPEALAAIFPRLRMAVYSTFSSTPEHPKWRAFIPTSHKVTVSIYRFLYAQILRRLNQEGYWHQDQLAKNEKIKVRRTHGLDASKYNPAQMFYLPSCKPDGSAGDFFDFSEAPYRGPLRVDLWLVNAIHDVAPNEKVYQEDEEEKDPRRAKLKALQAALMASQSSSYGGINQRKVDEALAEWHGTPKGQGNAAFFRFASRLQSAGMAIEDIRDMLNQHHGDSSSDRAARKAQIRSIITSLMKRGSISGLHGNARL